ncbi:MAG TPA: nucleoside triphosphate pyrophosphohydrolase family protein [Candidatus Saccharibacteria bacterium]|nr:nucleoside triphosphate pyrophosphohydrolase family protein [Candidatus Saccharibacteria bacterium]
MTIEEYSKQALTTLTDQHGMQDVSPALMAQVLGLLGESGEVAEKFKKVIRDKNGKLTAEDKQELVKELGDILWYVNSVATLLDSNLSEVAEKNLKKLQSRKERGALEGSGDNR